MPANPASTIIQSAKSMARDIATLQAGNDRKDADLRKLREALAKERRRFSWVEFLLGAFSVLFLVWLVTGVVLINRHG